MFIYWTLCCKYAFAHLIRYPTLCGSDSRQGEDILHMCGSRFFFSVFFLDFHRRFGYEVSPRFFFCTECLLPTATFTLRVADDWPRA